MDLNIFLKRITAGPFQESGNAQTAPQAPGFGVSLPLGKALPVGLFQGPIHDHLKGASVIDLAHGIFVGHLFRFDEIFASQFDAVNAADTRRFVHQTFHVVNGFGSACSSVSARASGVGHHASEVVVNGLNVVHATLHPRANEHLDGQTCHGGVGAHIG